MGNPNNYEGGFHFVTYHHNKLDTSEREKGSFRHYLNYIESGGGLFSTEDASFRCTAGDFFFIPADIPYSAVWTNSAVVHSCGFRLFPESRNVQYPIQQLPRRFIPEFLSIPLEGQPDSVALGKFYTLLGKLLPHMQAMYISSENRLLEKLRLYIWRYPDCHVEDLAHHCGISVTALYNTLRDLTGMTPHRFKLEHQIEKAKNYLVATKSSIQRVSDEARFCNPAYFRKVFKECTGMTPTQYRKLNTPKE